VHSGYGKDATVLLSSATYTIFVTSLPLLKLLLLLLHPFNDLFYQDNLGKPAPERQNHSGLYWSKRWCGSGISWTIYKSLTPCSRQI